MSGEFDSRKNSQSTKFEQRPQIFVKLSFRSFIKIWDGSCPKPCNFGPLDIEWQYYTEMHNEYCIFLSKVLKIFMYNTYISLLS